MAESASGDFTTIIGADAVFKGELKFEKSVRHLGRFEGQIVTKGHLLVAEGSKLSGDVAAASIDVQGEVKGNLKISGKASLTSTARLEGDLQTARLEVADGAVFIGRCVLGPDGNGKNADAKAPAPAVASREPIAAVKK